uniref:Uncharacterized protein n=1 Tax=Panagrolaimus sp. ES5 TaxID=591445 RepID=A0AC34G8A7_9BILA
MKAVLAVLVLGVVITQMANAKNVPNHRSSSESEEIHEDHDVSAELAEIKHELAVLQARFLNIGLYKEIEADEEIRPQDSVTKAHGKTINKKSLGDLFQWFGTNVLG